MDNHDAHTMYTCNADGVWVKGDACGANKMCGTDASGKAACVDEPVVQCDKNGVKYDIADTYCDDANNKLFTCQEDGTFDEGIVCEGQICRKDGTSCEDFKSCGAVAHNALTCDDQNVKKCADGTLTLVTDCKKDSKVCAASNSTFECIQTASSNCTDPVAIKNGSKVCHVAAGVASIYTCNNGTATSASCNAPENAKAICDAADQTKCAFVCNDGYLLNDAGTGCVAISKYTTIKAIRDDFNKFSDFAGDKTCAIKATSDTKAPANVEIKGVVTGIRSNGLGFTLQDKDAGVLVYGKDLTEGLALGDEVVVKADAIGQYFCELQVRASSADNPVQVTKTGQNKPVTPIAMTIQQAKASNAPNDANHSKLVTVTGAVSSAAYDRGYTLEDAGKAIKASNYFMVKNASDNLKGKLSVGKRYKVTGVVLYSFKNRVVAPRLLKDAVEVCTNGAFICQNGKFKKCENEAWTAEASCTKAQIANPDHAATFTCNTTGSACAIATCDEGFKPNANGDACIPTACVHNGQTYDLNTRVCIDDKTVGICSGTGVFTTEACGKRVCDPETKTCVDSPSCSKDTDCQDGFVCNLTTHTCNPMTCQGNDYTNNSTYTVNYTEYGCKNDLQYLVCLNSQYNVNPCGDRKYCNPKVGSVVDTSTLCVECVIDEHCASLNDPSAHALGYCESDFKCDYKCEEGYTMDANGNCVSSSGGSKSIELAFRSCEKIKESDQNVESCEYLENNKYKMIIRYKNGIVVDVWSIGTITETNKYVSFKAEKHYIKVTGLAGGSKIDYSTLEKKPSVVVVKDGVTSPDHTFDVNTDNRDDSFNIASTATSIEFSLGSGSDSGFKITKIKVTAP